MPKLGGQRLAVTLCDSARKGTGPKARANRRLTVPSRGIAGYDMVWMHPKLMLWVTNSAAPCRSQGVSVAVTSSDSARKVAEPEGPI